MTSSDQGRSSQDPEPEDERNSPSASEALSQALGGAARRAGMDVSGEGSAGSAVWKSIGGVRGIIESVTPTILFVVSYVLSGNNLVLAVLLSVGAAAVLTIARLLVRQPFGAAIGGMVAALIAAGWALMTGNAVDAFLWGLIVNGIYGLALLVSALVGWPVVGLAAGFLMGEGTSWRSDPRKRRTFVLLTLGWAALFALRLAVQLPFYFAGDVAGLGAWKLIMGLPPFAVLIAVTWFAVRRLYPRAAHNADR